ncbi:Uncharacterized protein dnm_036100 [Desulfonema magnum]|uniref:Uncharacterized protein n=1 Tax=Desulfonema magnum TaxID=45655 RepID=A0A975BLG6_9BACT|nr:Uncharacterized protein dnm_036100 [Desulfonema magnum]
MQKIKQSGFLHPAGIFLISGAKNRFALFLHFGKKMEFF